MFRVSLFWRRAINYCALWRQNDHKRHAQSVIDAYQAAHKVINADQPKADVLAQVCLLLALFELFTSFRAASLPIQLALAFCMRTIYAAACSRAASSGVTRCLSQEGQNVAKGAHWPP